DQLGHAEPERRDALHRLPAHPLQLRRADLVGPRRAGGRHRPDLDELLMAGYRHQAKVYKLTFEDYPGLVIETKSVSTGRLMKLMRMAVRLQDKDVSDASGLTEEDAEAVDALDRKSTRLNSSHVK